MPRMVYDPKVKAAFLKAARDAIRAGKGMDAALKAAKESGYGGGMSGMKKMLWPPKKKAKKSAEAAPTPAPATRKGRRKRYSAKVKAAFLAAAQEARDAGKSWAQAHEVAKKAGYTGSKPGLVQQFLAAKKKGAVTKAKHTGRALTAPVSGLESIQRLVDKLVAERVNAAIEKAIDALKAVAEQAD
jgi:hypothetical protein